MGPAPFIVVVDANVLYPLTLRDTVLRAAAAGFYQLRWSADILEEMERNLVLKGGFREIRSTGSWGLAGGGTASLSSGSTRRAGGKKRRWLSPRRGRRARWRR
jgi:hypothetical protein